MDGGFCFIRNGTVQHLVGSELDGESSDMKAE